MTDLNLRQLRRAKDISQQTVADYMGVSAATMARWEEEPGKIAINDCKKLCDFYDVPFTMSIFLSQ